MWPNPQFPADLVTFSEEIFNGKLHFLCSASKSWSYSTKYQIDFKNEEIVIQNQIDNVLKTFAL